MTASNMSVPPARGSTPFKRFENALKAILAVPKPEVEKAKREKAKKPKR